VFRSGWPGAGIRAWLDAARRVGTRSGGVTH
jgi:hypothetical protein